MIPETIKSPKEEENDDSEVFFTPLKRYDDLSYSPTGKESPFLARFSKSPTKSPGKRGIIKLEKLPDNSIELSSVKTPNGRAGLPSPKRRPVLDLDKSARKRAIKSSSIYSRLMDEDGADDNDDYLDRQDISLAEVIIRESRDEKNDGLFRAYGSDVEFEEDLTEVKIQKRGHKSKQNKRSKRELKKLTSEALRSDEDSSVVIEDDINSGEHSEDEYIPGKTKSQRKRRYALEDEDIEDKDNDISEGSPRKRRRQEPKRLGFEEVETSRRKDNKHKDKEPAEKRRVGRPSKSDEVIGKVKSIFQMDDEQFFQENKKPNPNIDLKFSSPRKYDDFDETKDSLSMLSMHFDYTEDTSVPIISGIPESKERKNVSIEQTDSKSFTPLPIPRVDANGQVVDNEFIQKYFPNSKIDTQLEGKLIDEKAFFLEGSEGYFEQHSTKTKPSANSLSQLAPPLEYDEFIPFVQLSELIQSKEKNALNNLHRSLYHQWCFELTQGYNLNFYGVGSKIKLILDFVQNYLVEWYEKTLQENDEYPNILVVNGYNPTVKFKKVIQDIVTAFIPQERKKKDNIRFPKHVSETVPFVMNYIESHRPQSPNIIKPKLILAIHNIDGEAFRDEKTQSLLSQLCTLPEIWLISSTDNINISLLWDSFKLKNFNFLWHDLTTYDSYHVEMSFKDVLSIGKSKKFVGNKGAKYVLSSLTSNARNLYRILLTKQLEIMKKAATTKSARTGLRGTIKFGIDFKSFYNACLEEFVTSNKISFRTMLGEFVEHKMCNLTKDDAGVEVVYVPFSFDEMQKLLTEEFDSN